MNRVVISLCDYTGIFVEPWRKAGYHCILVDPQHKKTGKVEDNIYTISGTIEEAFPPLTETQVPDRYREVAASGKTWRAEQIDYCHDGIVGAFECQYQLL